MHRERFIDIKLLNNFEVIHLKKFFIFGSMIGLLILLSACATKTELTAIWEDKEYQGPPFKKILVIAIAKDEKVRKMFEEYFSERFAKRDIQAVSSAKVLPPDAEIERETIREAISGQGFDAVLASRLLNVDDRKEVIPGQTQIVKHDYYDHLYQSYRTTYSQEAVPDTELDQRVVVIETNVYSVEATKLVYSAETETVDPGDTRDAIKSLSRVIIQDLYNAAFID